MCAGGRHAARAEGSPSECGFGNLPALPGGLSMAVALPGPVRWPSNVKQTEPELSQNQPLVQGMPN